MKRAGASMIVFAVACAAGPVAAQPGAPANCVDSVEVVGCLEEGRDGTWTVTKATEPEKTTSLSTTKEALKQAESKPLGSGRYRLLGAGIFSPELHKGHKVAVRGLLINDPKESRLNITSLQMVAGSCAK